jgi:hypothetical protein
METKLAGILFGHISQTSTGLRRDR